MQVKEEEKKEEGSSLTFTSIWMISGSLLLPSASNNLHYLERKVKASSERLQAHLLSILVDSKVVDEVKEFLHFLDIPFLGNLRNGAWYSNQFDSFCYFKSTDGHSRNLSFNVNRLNLDTAATAFRKHGLVIVDSTKQGKRYPDSLTSTIPIWACVINLILLEKEHPEKEINKQVITENFARAPSVSRNYYDVLVEKIIDIYTTLPLHIKNVVRESLHDVLIGSGPTKPLKVIWLTPLEDGSIEWEGKDAESFLDMVSASNAAITLLEYTPILLLSCSGAKNSLRNSTEYSEENIHESVFSWSYLAGAGDDEEAWSLGLTPSLFWRYQDRIVGDGCKSAAEVEESVREIIALDANLDPQRDEDNPNGDKIRVEITKIAGTNIALNIVDEVPSAEDETSLTIVIHVGNVEDAARSAEDKDCSGNILHINVDPTKRNKLHNKGAWGDCIIPRCVGFCQGKIHAGVPITVVCIKTSGNEGREVAALCALTILLAFFDMNMNLGVDAPDAPALPRREGFFSLREESAIMPVYSKMQVRAYLSALQTSLPGLYPQRWLLKEVMAHFINPLSPAAAQQDASICMQKLSVEQLPS